jgi:hypothetical protein
MPSSAKTDAEEIPIMARKRKRDANWIIAQAKTICQDHQ